MQPPNSPSFRLLLVVSIVLWAGLLAAAEPKEITSVEGITEYRLENGLSVLLFPDSSQPSVTVNVTYLVGSRHEGYGQTGMAHLLEHMLFKGTPSHPDVPKILVEKGAQFNGSTWVDRTNYFETLTASDENLEFALRLEADRMVNSRVSQEDLDSEMTVVRNEFEQGENSPSLILDQRVASAAYDWHNYGNSTIGNRSDIERMPVEKLRAFYRKYYQPDNAVLVVAGRFEKDKALSLIQEHFGTIPRPERKLERTYTEEPAQDGERMVVLRRVGEVGLVAAAYHVPAGAHPDFPSVRVLRNILITAPSGRLYKALVEAKKAASVSGYADPFHDPGLFTVFAEVRRENSMEEVQKILLEGLEGLGEKGVTEEEVNRAREQILKQRELALANTSRLAIELSEWAAQADWRLYFLYRDRIEKVTPQSVQDVAKRYLQRNNRTLGLYIPTDQPQRVEVPATPDVAEMVRDYKGRETVAVGEEFDVAWPNIGARTVRDQLPSGIKVALLPKKNRAETVYLRLVLRYGDEENLKGLVTATSFLGKLMTRGTKSLSRQELRDLLDKHRAVLSGGGDLGEVRFFIKTKKPELPAVLDLLRQVLREPTLPEDEFEIIRQQQMASIEQARTEPRPLAGNRVRRRLSPYPKGDVRYVPDFEETAQWLADLKLEDVKKLYTEYLGGQHGELAIVGDVDPQVILPIFAQMLDGWEAAQPYTRIQRRTAEDLAGSSEQILTPDKANAVYFAGLTVALDDAHPDYPALLIGNYILGGAWTSSRLGNRIRQKEGLSYGVRSSFSASALDPVARLRIYAISNPDNTPRLAEIVQEEIGLLLEKGIPDDELTRAKDGYLRHRTVSRTREGALVGILGGQLHNERTVDYEIELEEALGKLTSDQVVAALKKHVDPKRLVIVTAGDFKDGQ